MNTFINLVSNNALVSGIILAAILTGIGSLWRWNQDRKDGKTIYEFLAKSVKESEYTFRSSAAIASSTKLPEERVAMLCSRNPKIRRNQLDKQSWALEVKANQKREVKSKK